MRKELAIIDRASLEIKERGILNFSISVTYENGCSQGVGGLALDTYNLATKTRVGTAYGCEMIRQLLICLNVNDFSEMKGKHVWVFGEGDGLNFRPTGIQLLAIGKKNVKPLMFDEIAKQFEGGD